MGRDEVIRKLTDDLTAQGGEEIRLEQSAGPLDTVIVTARALEGLYPGANARVAVLDGERAYGAVIGPDLGAFLRDRGLDSRAIDAATLVALHDAMALDGALVVSSEPGPTRVGAVDGADVIHVVSLDPMSGEPFDYTLHIPSDGPAELRPAPATEAPVVPLTRAVGLARALEDRDALAMSRALEPFGPPLDDGERALLARVAAMPNDALTWDALGRLDATPASAAALREATRDDPAARARLVALAATSHGAAFAEAIAASP